MRQNIIKNNFCSTGGMQDYNYIFHGCMELTLEISCCKYPFAKELPKLWDDNREVYMHPSSHHKFNPLNPELNPICYLLALLGAHHFLHVSRIRVKLLTFRLLMSYIYGAPILDVSRSHTTTQHSR